MAVYTQDQYVALCAAIAQGVTSVQYGDKTVQYRTLAEMRSIKKEMENDLGLSTSGRTKYIQHSKGLQ